MVVRSAMDGSSIEQKSWGLSAVGAAGMAFIVMEGEEVLGPSAFVTTIKSTPLPAEPDGTVIVIFTLLLTKNVAVSPLTVTPVVPVKPDPFISRVASSQIVVEL